jgi:ferredoxin
VSASRTAYDTLDLIVWSGTGNTRHVAERIADSARLQGTAARVLTNGIPVGEDPPPSRLVGLLAPTHGFTAPWPLIKAALTTPNVRGADAFVLVTRGGTRIAGRTVAGFEGTAAYLPAAILALRGARVRGAGAIDMPLNWTVVVPAAGSQDVSTVVARGDAQVDEFSQHILKGESAFSGFAQLALGVLILPLSLGYMLIARLMLAKMFFADERCTSCGTCEKHCPQGAVHLRGPARRPYWTYDCQNCMRCMSNCPTDAIQGGQAWLLFYVWLMSLPVAAVAAARVTGAFGVTGGLAGALVGLLSGYIWIVIVVWAAYGVLWMGLLVPGLRSLLARATFTRRYRRYRGPQSRT